MKKIRIGNDFVFNWAIERGGLPEDLGSVLEAKLTASVFGKKQEVPFTVSGNIITIEFTPEICNVIGSYNLLFTYILPDTGLSDEDRKCAVDVDAFQIVAKTAQADDSSEFSVTSDMAIAFKGDKGDSAYQVWLDAGNTGTEEDYLAYLQKPATDAIGSIQAVEQTVSENEDLRVSAESERDLSEGTRIQAENERLAAEIIRQSNEDNRIDNEATRVQNEAERISKEGIRQSNETDRVEAEGLRVQAESERVQAEIERVQAEIERENTIQEAVTATNLANEKANLANVAAQSANEAAGLADTARTELTTAVNTKLGEADAKIEEMDTTLSTYDGRVTQAEYDITQLAGDVSVKMKNLVTNGGFTNGTAGWTPSNVSGFTAVDSVAQFTATSKGGSITNNSLLDYAGGKKYFFGAYVKANSPRVDISTAGIAATYHSGSGNWELLYAIASYHIGGSYYPRIRDNSDNEWSPVYVRNVLAVSLSDVFGLGNEPTKTEFLLLLSIMGIEYFEGEITIPAQKVMQWQLKMIRQNRNAIVALGGTII